MRILNFGSLNIDYVYHVDHFLRPGETLLSDSYNIYAGGKGLNQSIALARAGAEVYHAGKVGREGELLLQRLGEAGVDITYVEIDDGPSGHTIIQVDKSGQNCILLYGGANRRITEEFADKVLKDFTPGDMLLLQNEISCMPYIMEKASQAGLEIALNPSPITSSLHDYPLDLVDWFFLNEIEGTELSGQTEVHAIADTLLAKYPNSHIVLTLGEEGVFYKDADIEFSHGIYQVDAVDTTAAGDTFTGYLIAGLAGGIDIHESIRRASKASAIAVSRPGASDSIPVLAEVLAADIKLKQK